MPLAAVLLAPACAGAGMFDLEDEEPRFELPFKLTGILDVRYAHASQTKSWLEGGTNKLRYGGQDINADGRADVESHVLAVPQFSLVVESRVGSLGRLHAHVNFDADTGSGNASAGLIEAFGVHEREGERGVFALKAGAFFPEISMEHPETAWSTRWTLTPSAIGSWVAEEVRAFGLEATLMRRFGGSRWTLQGAGFSGADQTGWALYHRGWAIHDHQVDLNGTYTLSNGAVERPFQELDGRPGFYGRASAAFLRNRLTLRGGWWSNNGRVNAQNKNLNGTQSVWQTYFWDAGARIDAGRLTLAGQYLKGATRSAAAPKTYFYAFYTLASVQLGTWNVAARYDNYFLYGALETGYAWTGAVQWNRGPRQRVSLEHIYALADPNLGATFTGPRRREIDRITQLNYRFRFGG